MRSRSRDTFSNRVVALALSAAFGFAGMSAVPALGADKPVATKASSPKPAAYYASVNGVSISREAFIARLEAAYGEDLLNELVAEVTISQAAAARKIVVTDEAVQAEAERSKALFKTPEDFSAALARNRLTTQTWKHQIWMRLVLEKLGAPSAPTDAQLKDYYEKNKAKYDQPEEVKVRHILVKTEDEGKTVLAELSKGGDFAKLAAASSIDLGSKDKGGDIGYARKGQLVSEFEEAAFTLKSGETSGLVKTKYGYHIIQLIDHRMPKAAEYASAREAVVKDWTTANTVKPADVAAKLKAESVTKVSDALQKAMGKGPAAKSAPAKK